MIVCVKEHDVRNIGDIAANPFDYFPREHVAMTPVHDSVEQLLMMQHNGAHVVVGGGGVFYDKWLLWLQQLFERRAYSATAGKLIIWGAGLNLNDQWQGYPDWVAQADLTGTRDWALNKPWVGCPSCMSAAFDRQYTISREVVIYDHGNNVELGCPTWLDAADAPHMSNFRASCLTDVLAFLGSAEVVLTSSYHGAYWATLLGRKVIAWPHSSKFRNFRHPPVLCKDGNWRAALPLATNYPDALETCRKSNLAFEQRVTELIGASPRSNVSPKLASLCSRPRIQLINDNLGIGDVVCLFGVAQAIKQALPASILHFVTTPGALAWASTSKLFDDVIAIPRCLADPAQPKLLEHKRLPRGGVYDAIIDLRCKGFAYEQETNEYRLDIMTTTAARTLGVALKAQPFMFKVTEQARNAARQKLTALVGGCNCKLVGLQPISLGASRTMSGMQLSSLIDELLARGIAYCVFHGGSDITLQVPSHDLHVVTAHTPAELLSLVAACNGLITVDSGLLHLAASLNVPVVGAFGNTDGQLICGRYSNCDWITAGTDERKGLNCNVPCYELPARGWNTSCSDGCYALQRIKSSMLVEKLTQLMARACEQPRAASKRCTQSRPVRRIQILRDYGGIGDLVMALQVASSIRAAEPAAKISLFVNEQVVPWTQLPWSNGMSHDGRMRNVVDAVMQVDSNGRRNINAPPMVDYYPYMSTGGPHDVLIDLFNDESIIVGPLVQQRLAKWLSIATAALGYSLALKPATVVSTTAAALQARYWLAAHVGTKRREPLIALQPLSYWQRRSMSLAQLTSLVTAIRARVNARFILFHHATTPVSEWATQLELAAAIALSPLLVTELIRCCDGMIAVDSGLLHVAGALSVPAVGVFGHTDGNSVCGGYPSCTAITAGALERDGLNCHFPCYGRVEYGYDGSTCNDGCRALQRIDMVRVAEVALARMGHKVAINGGSTYDG